MTIIELFLWGALNFISWVCLVLAGMMVVGTIPLAMGIWGGLTQYGNPYHHFAKNPFAKLLPLYVPANACLFGLWLVFARLAANI